MLVTPNADDVLGSIRHSRRPGSPSSVLGPPSRGRGPRPLVDRVLRNRQHAGRCRIAQHVQLGPRQRRHRRHSGVADVTPKVRPACTFKTPTYCPRGERAKMDGRTLRSTGSCRTRPGMPQAQPWWQRDKVTRNASLIGRERDHRHDRTEHGDGHQTCELPPDHGHEHGGDTARHQYAHQQHVLALKDDQFRRRAHTTDDEIGQTGDSDTYPSDQTPPCATGPPPAELIDDHRHGERPRDRGHVVVIPLLYHIGRRREVGIPRTRACRRPRTAPSGCGRCCRTGSARGLSQYPRTPAPERRCAGPSGARLLELPVRCGLPAELNEEVDRGLKHQLERNEPMYAR